MIKKAISAAQRKKDPKAGPHGSFPLDPAHLKAAWDLAGHAADPDAVRARVRAYAKAHGMEDHLPKDAQEQKAKGSDVVQKAKSSDVHDLLHTAYHLSEPHSPAREQLVRMAARKGLTHHLPPEAHAELHEYGIRHNHPNMNDGITPRLSYENEGDIQEDPDDPAYPLMHDHVVTKAFNPKVVNGIIQKSWSEGEDQFIEGWMSTPDRDIERDITEPEAFLGGPLTDYFARSAPLSLEHGTDTLPAGHLQKAVILRNGTPLEEASHPSDPAEFAHLPTTGSGVWVRGRLTDEPAKSAVRKGNVGGMSFTGNFTRYTRLPGGGKHFNQPGAINPLLESTVAAYPVNPKAAFRRVQKALGLSDTPTQEPETMSDEFDFDAFMQEAADRAEAKRAEEAAASQVQKSVTPEQLGDMLTQFMSKIETLIDAKVQKALPVIPERGEGVGRKGVATVEESANQFETDPINFLIQKAQKDGGHDQFDQAEKSAAGALMIHVLADGMAYGED